MAEGEAPPRRRRRPRQAGEVKPSRREAGTGHVRQLPSGRWNGQIMFGSRPGPGGQRRRWTVSVTRDTAEEVEARLVELRAWRGSSTLPDRLPVADRARLVALHEEVGRLRLALGAAVEEAERLREALAAVRDGAAVALGAVPKRQAR